MKKSSKIAIVIAIVAVLAIAGIVIGIVAGGNKKMSKEKMLEVAKTFSGKQAESDLRTNEKNAKEKYENQIYIFSGKVATVGSKSVEIRSDYSITTMRIFLNDAELSSLKQGEQIKVVGRISDFGHYSGDAVNFSYEFTMKEAYLLDD